MHHAKMDWPFAKVIYIKPSCKIHIRRFSQNGIEHGT